MSTANVIQESPSLGISFRQDDQVALMDYANYATLQIPVINVCLKSAPFEIWFPALATDTDIAICTSSRAAIFHQNPFAVTQTSYGCLAGGTGAADSLYSSGIPFESSPQGPPHTEIAGTRAEPASGGDETRPSPSGRIVLSRSCWPAQRLWLSPGGVARAGG